MTDSITHGGMTWPTFQVPAGLPIRLVGPSTACARCGATLWAHGPDRECPTDPTTKETAS